MYEIELPESGKMHPLKSLTRAQAKEVERLQVDLVSAKLSATEYQDRVLTMAYPSLALEGEGVLPSADLAHLARVTASYSLAGPDSVKNLLRSGSGTATA